MKIKSIIMVAIVLSFLLFAFLFQYTDNYVYAFPPSNAPAAAIN